MRLPAQCLLRQGLEPSERRLDRARRWNAAMLPRLSLEHELLSVSPVSQVSWLERGIGRSSQQRLPQAVVPLDVFGTGEGGPPGVGHRGLGAPCLQEGARSIRQADGGRSVWLATRQDGAREILSDKGRDVLLGSGELGSGRVRRPRAEHVEERGQVARVDDAQGARVALDRAVQITVLERLVGLLLELRPAGMHGRLVRVGHRVLSEGGNHGGGPGASCGMCGCGHGSARGDHPT
eukprot:scaffold36065_cov54-Phaeocystis_antarctica.AAC.4